MIPKKSLDSVLDKSIILTKTTSNDNAKSISVQCVCGGGGWATSVQCGLSKDTYFKFQPNLDLISCVKKEVKKRLL